MPVSKKSKTVAKTKNSTIKKMPMREVEFMDATVMQSSGGETHQVAEGSGVLMTTQHGMPISDDQNSLKIGSRGPVSLEDHVHVKKSFTLTMKESRSA